MACCSNRRRVQSPTVQAGPGTQVAWYAIGPNNELVRGPTVMEARAAAKSGGKNWTIVSIVEQV